MTAAKDVKSERLYTKDHEWALQQGNETLVGVTVFAVDQLGDITLVDISASPGQQLKAHEVFGTVESVKTLSDVFAPLSGKVTRVNEQLAEHPEWLNEDCWDKGWMIAFAAEAPLVAGGDLLDAAEYAKYLEQLA
jgi:glycine cleavage system H protein